MSRRSFERCVPTRSPEMPMRVVLLPAIGEEIGLGHLQRCVALARALHGSGHRPVVIVDLPRGGVSGAVRALVPHDIQVVRTIEDAFEGFSDRPRVEWVVVDDYAADASYDRALRRFAERVLVLDDHASRVRDADLLLSQALTRTVDDYAGRVPDRCTILVGPRHALVRPEFGSHVRTVTSNPTSSVGYQVFVAMGGTDAGNTLDRVLMALARLAPEKRHVVHVMISTLSRAADRLDALLDRLPYECVVHRDLHDPVALMAGCDVAVTAGGMTSFELATLGVPSVIVPSTPLEAEVACVLAQHSEMCVIEADDPEWEKALLSALGSIGRHSRTTDPRVFDGGGAGRVVRIMEEMIEDSTVQH